MSDTPRRLKFTDSRGPFGLSAWWWLGLIVFLLVFTTFVVESLRGHSYG